MLLNMVKWVVILIFGVTMLSTCAGDLTDSLHHYELLHDEQINHRISKRSLSEDEDIVERDVSFQSFGRDFNLKLTKRVGLFNKGFKAFAINKNNKQRKIDVDTESYYGGYDKSEPWSSVASAYWDDSNSLTAMIKTKHETYMIEPAWRHIDDVRNNSMIAYKESDLKWDNDLGKKYCAFVRPDQENYTTTGKPETDSKTHSPDSDDAHERYRRQAQSGFSFKPKKTTCPLLLVADYRFFRTMGQYSLSLTTSYLIGLIDRVDTIYRSTDFGKGFNGMGFEIKEIRVHEEPTAVSGSAQHYNEEKDVWETKELLEEFSEDISFQGFCLAHLFTHQPFRGGVLGLAYISSPRKYSVGGACSPVYYKGGSQLYLNTGWSSSLNRYNRRLLTSEADLVTTHEFGHNWGSEHDPDTDECSPSSYGGGKYIMYTYSVSGYDNNNKVFSPCSRRAISTVLEAKHDVCFREPSDGFCGNMRVEGDEDCDPGPSVKKDVDPCCNKYCKFRGNAECSDVNSVCCDSCQFASTDKVCHHEQEESCDGEATCTGMAADCPTPGQKDNGTPCIGGGTCEDGRCLPFCESNKLLSCICDALEESCQRCCRDPNVVNSTCKPFNDGSGTKRLLNGLACVQGYCNEGVCEKQVENLVERIWDIIEDITTSNFVEFMRANIVGTVIVFSLVLWIPLSCIVSYIDRKKKREEENRIVWHANDNKDLISDFDRASLTITKSKKIRNRGAYTPQPDSQMSPGFDQYARTSQLPSYTQATATQPAQSTYEAKLLKARPPPVVTAPPRAPTARISESSDLDSPDYVPASPDYRRDYLDDVDEGPFDAETTFTEDSALLAAKADQDTVDSSDARIKPVLMRDTVINMDNSFHMKIDDGKRQNMNQVGGSDASLVLPEYVWKPDPKGRTNVDDLPPANLEKVQDFIRQQRKELDRYYRLNKQRKDSFVGTPKPRKEKFTPLKSDHRTDECSPRRGVFGRTLEDLLEQDRLKDPDRRVPLFFEELIGLLEKSVCEEGILRRAGGERRVKDLKEEINADFYDERGFSWDTETVLPNDAASLLKHFLKDLPVKLLSTPGEHPDAFLRVQGIQNTEDQLKALHLLVLLITDVQRDTLQLLLRYFKKVVDNHKENKMTPGNVAVVMAPNLFPFDMGSKNFEKIGLDNVFSMKAVQMLLKYKDILWSIPQFVMTEIRRKFGSQQGLLNMSLSPVSQFGSLKHKIPQILTEKYFTELVKIKVTIPHLSKTTRVELEERTTAKDILEKFHARLFKKFSGTESERPTYFLYEVGGNMEERKLPMDSVIISIQSDNPRADWIIK